MDSNAPGASSAEHSGRIAKARSAWNAQYDKDKKAKSKEKSKAAAEKRKEEPYLPFGKALPRYKEGTKKMHEMLDPKTYSNKAKAIYEAVLSKNLAEDTNSNKPKLGNWLEKNKRKKAIRTEFKKFEKKHGPNGHWNWGNSISHAIKNNTGEHRKIRKIIPHDEIELHNVSKK